MVKKAKSKESLRNLAQFKSLSDEEFEQVWIERQAKIAEESPDKEDLEDRILDMMEKFKDDYALDDRNLMILKSYVL